MSSVFVFENEVFRSFIFYAALVVLKMVFMSFITGFTRISNNTFANPEDAAQNKTKVNKNDESVERIRRAHLNDIENILPFFCLASMYISINPSPTIAINCFRVFAAVRIVHTISYLTKLFAPRGICFGIGALVNVFMAVNIIISAM